MADHDEARQHRIPLSESIELTRGRYTDALDALGRERHFGDDVDDLAIAYDRAEALIRPETRAAVRAARAALRDERALLADIAAQIENHDEGFRDAVNTNIELIEAAIEGLDAVPDDEPPQEAPDGDR